MKTPTRSLLVCLWSLVSCGGPEVYRPCASVADCVDPVPEDTEGVCLEKSQEGFCTWTCTHDDDCDDGEHPHPLVCAGFEDEAGSFCFPSCDDGDSDDEGGGEDGEGACPAGFVCRSTGGGSANRKICFPDT